MVALSLARSLLSVQHTAVLDVVRLQNPTASEVSNYGFQGHSVSLTFYLTEQYFSKQYLINSSNNQY